MTIPVIAFVGWHNSGKTTLIRNVIKELTLMGVKVGVVKDTKHSELDIDAPGTDSFFYQKDGVKDVALTNPAGMFFFRKGKGFDLDYLIFRMFHDVDLVIAEGFKHIVHIPKIEVARKEISDVPLSDVAANVVAMVSDFETGHLPRFNFNDTPQIAGFIVQNFLSGLSMCADVFVDQKKVWLDEASQKQLRDCIENILDKKNQTLGKFPLLNGKSIELKITV